MPEQPMLDLPIFETPVYFLLMKKHGVLPTDCRILEGARIRFNLSGENIAEFIKDIEKIEEYSDSIKNSVA